MKILFQAFTLLVSFFFCSQLYANHGLSIDGSLKYPSNFKSFDYVSSDAVKGGTLVLHEIGSFDKMNPFTLKGTAPAGLELYLFEPLAQKSLDEPFTLYGLLAENIEIAEDQLSVVFTLNKKARFSDGTPVLAEDVKFTIDMLKSDLVHPFYPYYYADIEKAEILDKRTVRFTFKQKNRELALIAGEISIMSKHFYEEHGFQTTDMRYPVGSGPYVVSSYNQGKTITYKRNPRYWAVDHPVRKGMYNFDEIIIKYYKDPVVAVEAFKAGDFDAMQVNIAKQWARDMTGPRFTSGSIVKKIFPHKNNAGIQGFVMNTRRPIFSDRVVRKALGMAFDFEWTNKTLFFGQYKRNESFFSNSYLAAKGLPGADELQLLSQFKDSLPEEVFTVPMGEAPVSVSMREMLRQASLLLKEDGWTLKNGILQNKDGEQLSFEILLVNPSFERVMAAYTNNLKKIGVQATYRTIDPALYAERMNTFDFDMCVFVFGQSLSPGNEQRNYWHSESASKNGSRNVAGIKNPAIDYLIERIIYAQNQKELTIACKALDRVLWHGYYLIPNWYLEGYRVAYHNKFSMPRNLPTYYNYDSLLMTWWIK